MPLIRAHWQRMFRATRQATKADINQFAKCIDDRGNLPSNKRSKPRGARKGIEVSRYLLKIAICFPI